VREVNSVTKSKAALMNADQHCYRPMWSP